MTIMDQMRGDIDIRTLCFDLDSFNKLIAPPTVYNCVHACSLKKSQRRLPKNLGGLSRGTRYYQQIYMWQTRSIFKVLCHLLRILGLAFLAIMINDV